MIAVIDYGRGNLGSVEQAFVRVGVPAVVTQDSRVVDEADAVVLPGDGAFHDAMTNLETLGLMAAVQRALDGRRPFLGICLGYQLLFSTSEEFGQGRGLDAIPGSVRRFPPGRKIPHMGWNRVRHGGDVRLFEGIPDGAHFYFVHSYYPVIGAPAMPGGSGGAGSSRPPTMIADVKVAWCDYGIRFAAAIERGALHATQFHPEKSQRWGLRMLENFAGIVKDARSGSVPAARDAAEPAA